MLQQCADSVGNAGGHVWIVHGVDVDAVYAVGQEIYNLIDGIGDSGIAQGDIVMTIPGQDLLEFQWKSSSAKSDHPFYLFLVGYGHDTRFDRNADSSLGRFVEEVIKIVIIEEKLGDEFAGTGIDFDLQMVYVFCQCFRIGMAFGIACADDIEFITCLLTDEGDEVTGMGKYAFWFDAGRFISAQGQNIFDTVFP